MPSSHLRSAKTSDARAIERVARRSWHAAYDDFLGEGVVEEIVGKWYDREGLRDATREDGHVFVLAVKEGAVQGFAHAGPSAEHDGWSLFRIYVVPGRWGEGIGTALLERVEEELEARGVSTYELAVLAANDVGVSFYEARGFDRFDIEDVVLAGVETSQHWYRKTL
ncbi:N-acetyltransferase [Halobacteriales archaeon QS_3_64_16]|nr:MAG: N-acetyltransferase [Halobacteriales archaeon QS_3_64_16]